MVSVQTSLNPYVTSSFHSHGLLTSVSIVSTILSGCTRLAIAKIIDIWGRVAGFLFMLLIVVVGMIMKAVCKNIETYFAAHTLYWTGYIGMSYVIDVMVSDMTTLKNRMIMFGMYGTPTIASTFAGPRIADLFYANLNFRWAFGAFGIIIAGVSLPVAIIMMIMERKALRFGVLKQEKSGRTWYQSIEHFVIELDSMWLISIYLDNRQLTLSTTSHRYRLGRRGVCAHPPPIQPCHLCAARLEDWIHHCHVGYWNTLPPSLLLLGSSMGAR